MNSEKTEYDCDEPEIYKDTWILRIRGKKILADRSSEVHRYTLFELHSGVSAIEADSKSELLVKMAVYGFALDI